MKISRRRRHSPKRRMSRKHSPKRRMSRKHSPKRRMSRKRLRFSVNNELLTNLHNLPDEMLLQIMNKLPEYDKILLAVNLDRPGLIGYPYKDYKKRGIIKWFMWTLFKNIDKFDNMTNKDFLLLKRNLQTFFIHMNEDELYKAFNILGKLSIDKLNINFLKLIPKPIKYYNFSDNIRNASNLISWFKNGNSVLNNPYNRIDLFLITGESHYLKNINMEVLYPRISYTKSDLKRLIPYFKRIYFPKNYPIYNMMVNDLELRSLLENNIYIDNIHSSKLFKDKFPELYDKEYLTEKRMIKLEQQLNRELEEVQLSSSNWLSTIKSWLGR